MKTCCPRQSPGVSVSSVLFGQRKRKRRWSNGLCQGAFISFYCAEVLLLLLFILLFLLFLLFCCPCYLYWPEILLLLLFILFCYSCYSCYFAAPASYFAAPASYFAAPVIYFATPVILLFLLFCCSSYFAAPPISLFLLFCCSCYFVAPPIYFTVPPMSFCTLCVAFKVVGRLAVCACIELAQTLGFCFVLIMRKHLAFALFCEDSCAVYFILSCNFLLVAKGNHHPVVSNHKGSAQTAFLHEEHIESYFLNIFSFDCVDRQCRFNTIKSHL